MCSRADPNFLQSLCPLHHRRPATTSQCGGSAQRLKPEIRRGQRVLDPGSRGGGGGVFQGRITDITRMLEALGRASRASSGSSSGRAPSKRDGVGFRSYCYCRDAEKIDKTRLATETQRPAACEVVKLHELCGRKGVLQLESTRSRRTSGFRRR